MVSQKIGRRPPPLGYAPVSTPDRLSTTNSSSLTIPLTKASTYKTQHCFPEVIDNDLRSTADLLLQALSNMRLSSEDSSSPPRPSNFGEACAELK